MHAMAQTWVLGRWYLAVEGLFRYDLRHRWEKLFNYNRVILGVI